MRSRPRTPRLAVDIAACVTAGILIAVTLTVGWAHRPTTRLGYLVTTPTAHSASHLTPTEIAHLAPHRDGHPTSTVTP